MHSTIVLLLSATALAFNMRFFDSKDLDCKNEVTDLIIRDPKLSDGCQKIDDKHSGHWLLVDWTKEEDNDLIIQFFEDESCCNGQTGATDLRTGWTDKCQLVEKNWYKSWRIMDPNDVNKGKNGEKYDCEKKV